MTEYDDLQNQIGYLNKMSKDRYMTRFNFF